MRVVVLLCLLTAYTQFDLGMDGLGITFSGVSVTANHTIAVDPDVIPLGSWVLIDSELYHAEDTGSAIRGSRLDVYIPDRSKALEFGVQRKKVVVIEPDSPMNRVLVRCLDAVPGRQRTGLPQIASRSDSSLRNHISGLYGSQKLWTSSDQMAVN